jgi:hypothetical protein
MLLIVGDPDAVCARAVAAGAIQVVSVQDGHGWRPGRILDPFGHHWEVGRPPSQRPTRPQNSSCRFLPSPFDESTKPHDEGSPMRYMMFVCVDPEAEAYVPEEDNIEDWVAEMDQREVRLFGNRLKGVKDATTIRRRDGRVIVTDGPFAETKEWIAGFDLLECADLDMAIEIASQHPMARFGRIEIRPLLPEE